MGRHRRIYQLNIGYGKDNAILLEQINMPDNKPTRGKFICSCGNIFEVRMDSIINGRTIGCGCKEKLGRISHGLTSHPLYNTYNLIKTRCYCETNEKYKYYGARGIKMSDEFLNSFTVFLQYVMSLPNYEDREVDKLTLDRVDNDKDYERGNLRWATQTEQVNNRRPYGTLI